MSIKTLRKRIALVAVSALSAGTLSIVTMPSAFAGDLDFDISTTASTTGSGVVSSTIANARSVGYVTATNTAGTNLDDGEAATGIVLAGAQIPFLLQGDANGQGLAVVVTGGTLSQINNDAVGGDTTSVNGARTTAVTVQAAATVGKLIGLFTVDAAVGSVVSMSAYQGTGIAGTTTATNGALVGSFTFTVAAASASGTYSAANSTIAVQAAYTKGTTASGLLTYDNTSRIDNGKVAAIYVNLKDAYTAPITTGVLTASATNNAGVNIVDTAPAAGQDFAATSSFDSETDVAGGDAYIHVLQPVANTAGTSTVTITFNGAVIATKTLNWNGDIASIEVSTADSNNVFLNGVTADGANNRYAVHASGIVYIVKDAAGNAVNISSAPTLTGATGALVGASLTTSTADTFGTLMNTSDGYGLTSMVIPSSTLNGAGTYKIRVTNSAGQNIDSAVVNATVSASSLNSFAVSWDKTTYAPGDIATLTVTGKDIYGNPIADGYYAVGLTLAGLSGFTSVGTACSASTKAFSGGKFTCTYAAGNDGGSYSYSFDMSTYTAQAASVGKVDIKTTAVSNAEVLAAVVKLIAQISKQIKLLQKQLRK